MNDFEYIKKFSKITITKACKDLKLCRTSVVSGRCKTKDLNRVRKYLESEVAKLYLYEDERKSNSL